MRPNSNSATITPSLLFGGSARRRREERQPTTGSGELCWRDRTGRHRATLATVLNINGGGMQVKISEALAFPQMVRLAGEDWECLGWTRYCVETVDGFVVGIELIRQPYLRNSCQYSG